MAGLKRATDRAILSSMILPPGKGARTRSAILDTALSRASEVGLEGLSLGSLAKEVGLSKSGLFSHFECKEALQVRVLEIAVERFVETVINPALVLPRGEPRVVAFFDNWLRWSRASFLAGGCFFIATANELDDRPGPLRERLVSYQKDWIDTLNTGCRLAVEEGHFRAELDTGLFAFDLYSILLAYHHFSRLIRDPSAEASARVSFETLLERSRL